MAEHEERTDRMHYRLFKAFLRGSFEGNAHLPRLRLVDADCVREVAQQILMEVGSMGSAVIVGRGSAHYLTNRKDVFHVFIYGSLDDKVRRLVTTGKSEKDALESVETVDRDRAAFIKRYFGHEWPSRPLFHLMLNSALGDDVVVETILNAAGIAGTDSGRAASETASLAEPRT